jgi:tRNA pseudouridine38-40 synthase
MVRNIAGVLMSIGRGDEAVSWVRELLESRDRTRGGVTAPAHGLYFVRADYPVELGLPRRKPLASH